MPGAVVARTRNTFIDFAEEVSTADCVRPRSASADFQDSRRAWQPAPLRGLREPRGSRHAAQALAPGAPRKACAGSPGAVSTAASRSGAARTLDVLGEAAVVCDTVHGAVVSRTHNTFIEFAEEVVVSERARPRSASADPRDSRRGWGPVPWKRLADDRTCRSTAASPASPASPGTAWTAEPSSGSTSVRGVGGQASATTYAESFESSAGAEGNLSEAPAERNTLLIKNIGCRCSEKHLSLVLDRAGLAGAYSTLAIPTRPKTKGKPLTNKGYAFVTVVHADWIQRCIELLHEKEVVFYNSARRLEVALARSDGPRAAPHV